MKTELLLKDITKSMEEGFSWEASRQIIQNLYNMKNKERVQKDIQWSSWNNAQ
jgi:hypothetical protein